MGNVESLIEENIDSISNNISNINAGFNNGQSGNTNDYFNNGNSNNVDTNNVGYYTDGSNTNSNSNNGYYNGNNDNNNIAENYNGNSNDNGNNYSNTGTNNSYYQDNNNSSSNNNNNNVIVNNDNTQQSATQNANQNQSYSHESSDSNNNQISSNQNPDANNQFTNPTNEVPTTQSNPVFIPDNNVVNGTVTQTPGNNASQNSNGKLDWINNTVFSIKGFNVSYLYIIIASASAVLLFSLLLLICVIVRRKRKNKRERMKLIDISNSSNLRNMLDETTSSQVGYDNDYHHHDDHSEEKVVLENNNNNNNNYLEYNDYLDYQDYLDYPEDTKPSPVSQHYQTLPNPKAVYPTGKTIDAFQPNYTRMSTPVFPTSTSTSPSQLYRKSSIVSTKYDCEFDSGYNFYSQNMKLNKSMLKSNSIKSKKYKKSPISNFIDLNNNEYNNVEDSPKSKLSQPTDILDEQYNYNNVNKNNTNNKTYLKNDMNNNNNKNNYNNYNSNNNNNNYNNYNNNNKNNNLYPQEGEMDNAYRNLFAEGKYKTMPQSNYQMHFTKNDFGTNVNGDGMKRKPMSCITPKDNYQSNQGYPLDFLYQQPQQLNTLSPIRNSLPNYKYDNLNTVNKMVSPTTRLHSTPVTSTNPFINNENNNIVYPPITMLNDEELINEQSRYPVDQDYMAIYNYQPVVNDELFITINDRIHLLQTYSDGWAYGKNVTTGRLGVFPLNRLSSVKKHRISSSVKSDRESEKTKVNINTVNEIASPSNKKSLSYSLSKLQRKNASQETLINRRNSNTYSNVDSPTVGSSTYVSSSNSKVKPKKSRTLIIKNFSDEDLRDKSQSTVLSNTEDKLESSIERRKGNNYLSKNRDSSEKLYFSNLRQDYKTAKESSREERKKESDDDLELDSVLRLKIDFDDFITGKPLSQKQNNTETKAETKTETKTETRNYFSDISIFY